MFTLLRANSDSTWERRPGLFSRKTVNCLRVCTFNPLAKELPRVIQRDIVRT